MGLKETCLIGLHFNCLKKYLARPILDSVEDEYVS